MTSTRTLRLLGAACLLLSLSGCESTAVPVVHVVLGSSGQERRSFQPKSAIADYVEFPGGGAELRVTLSSTPITCESIAQLEPDQVLVTLTLVAAPRQELGARVYPYVAPTEAPPVDGPGASAAPPPVTVLPHVRLGKVGHSIPPGGQAEITELVKDPQGMVRGHLKLEQPGNAGVAATSILGSFSARWCRFAMNAARESS